MTEDLVAETKVLKKKVSQSLIFMILFPEIKIHILNELKLLSQNQIRYNGFFKNGKMIRY